jgi:hypothetical protein
LEIANKTVPLHFNYFEMNWTKQVITEEELSSILADVISLPSETEIVDFKYKKNRQFRKTNWKDYGC